MIFFNNKEQVIYLQNYSISKITPMETGTLEVYKLVAHDADPMITYNIDSYEVNQIANYESIMTEIEATAGVPIVADFEGVDHIGGVNCLVECEPNPDYVDIFINITNANGVDGNDVEFVIIQNDAKAIYFNNELTVYDFNYTISTYAAEPKVYKLTINKKSVKGLQIILGAGIVAEISGLDQLENLELLKVVGSIPYSKVIGKLPRFLKYLDMSYSKLDDIDTTANTLLYAKFVYVDCIALCDWVEKMPESCRYAMVIPSHRSEDGLQELLYPLSINNSGRLTLNKNCVFMGLYFGDLSLDQIKILYNLFEGITPFENGMYLNFEYDSLNSETQDYVDNVLIPMLATKNIAIGEY